MDFDRSLDLLARDPHTSADVAELGMHLARDEYPDLDVEAYLKELDGMAHEARRYLRGSLPERVAGLCRYLFHDMGFRGNRRNYYDPRNSYLNQVLDRRTGIPIALSVLAIGVGNRAGLALAGVGLPGHFVVKTIDTGPEIVFDPFHGGRLLTREDCETLVEQVTGAPFRATSETLAPLPAGPILQRMLNNLKAIYFRDGDGRRAARVVGRLRQLTPDDPAHDRDLGLSLMHSGHPGKAIAHLSAYLARGEMPDAEAVLALLKRARDEVAKWN